jgi:hypothetical protein
MRSFIVRFAQSKNQSKDSQFNNFELFFQDFQKKILELFEIKNPTFNVACVPYQFFNLSSSVN